MRHLSVSDLHLLRLQILTNARDLHREAQLLLENQMHARAYLLAHYCFEELGKLPMIVGAVSKLQTGQAVDWDRLEKRMQSHTKKIESQNAHFYTFGLDLDLVGSSDLEWVKQANAAVKESYQKKNRATYVDVFTDTVSAPSSAITAEEARALVALTNKGIDAHELSEELINPLLKGSAHGA